MAHYIVCHRKRNNPRMDVRICENKCPEKDTCEEFQAYHKTMMQEEAPPPEAESHPLGLKAA